MQEGAGNRALHRIPLVTAHRVTVTSPAFSPGAGLIDVMIGSEVESDQFFFKKLCDQVPDLSLEELDIRVICPFYSNELYVRPFFLKGIIHGFTLGKGYRAVADSVQQQKWRCLLCHIADRARLQSFFFMAGSVHAYQK